MVAVGKIHLLVADRRGAAAVEAGESVFGAGYLVLEEAGVVEVEEVV